jgi:hypothetical protein
MTPIVVSDQTKAAGSESTQGYRASMRRHHPQRVVQSDHATVIAHPMFMVVQAAPLF